MAVQGPASDQVILVEVDTATLSKIEVPHHVSVIVTGKGAEMNRAGILILGFLLSTSCATIFSGTTQDVVFNSNPPGAKVTIFVDGVSSSVVTTPSTVNLSRGKKVRVDFVADGYAPLSMALEKGTAGWYWANLITMNLIGMVIDLVDGAAYKFDDQVMVTLTKSPGGANSRLDRSNPATLYAVIDFKDAHTGTFKRAMIPMKQREGGVR
jgi:hypothetical protein